MSKYSVVKALLGPKSDREVIEGVFDQYVFDLDENEFYISPKEMAENFLLERKVDTYILYVLKYKDYLNMLIIRITILLDCLQQNIFII